MRAQPLGNRFLKARIPPTFAAAMQALQLNAADASALRSLRDQEWRELLDILDRARLTLPLARQAFTGFPDWVRDRIGENLADTARNWESVRTAYREAAATLDSAGVEYVVLKGFTQSPDFVPRPELRRQSDIDLYMPPTQIPAAVRNLQTIGYAARQAEEDFRFADHVPTLLRFGAWKWNGNIYDPDVPPAIEVHFCLWNEPVYSLAIPEIEDFWNRRTVRKCGDLLFPGLDLIDHLGYFAMHIVRDTFCGGSTVHHLRELATFLDRRAGNDAFWREWTATHSPRLRSMQTIAFYLAMAWFSCNVSDTVQAEMNLLSPRVRAWLDTCGCASLEATFQRTRDGRLLQFLLAETPEARKKILWKALGPGHVSGPAKVATYGTHPTVPATRNSFSPYLAYPGYLLSRAWMNGSAILRFIVHAFLVNIRRVQPQPVSHCDCTSAARG